MSFFMYVIELLASSYILSLLQGKLISTNLALLSESESKLSLLFITRVDYLKFDFITFVVTKFKYIIVG